LFFQATQVLKFSGLPYSDVFFCCYQPKNCTSKPLFWRCFLNFQPKGCYVHVYFSDLFFFFLSAKKLYCKFVFFFRCVFFLIISLEIVPTNVYFFSPDLWLFAYYTGPKIVLVNVWVNVTLLSAKNCTSIFYLLLSFYSSWEDQSSVSFQQLRCVHFGCV